MRFSGLTLALGTNAIVFGTNPLRGNSIHPVSFNPYGYLAMQAVAEQLFNIVGKVFLIFLSDEKWLIKTRKS